jgi:hypothetical protein
VALLVSSHVFWRKKWCIFFANLRQKRYRQTMSFDEVTFTVISLGNKNVMAYRWNKKRHLTISLVKCLFTSW